MSRRRKKSIEVPVDEELPIGSRDTLAPEEPESEFLPEYGLGQDGHPSDDDAEPDSIEEAVAQVIPIQQYKITVERFTIGMGTLGEAFRACEKTAHRTTRKLTREAWQAEYEAFVSRPRG